MKFYGRETEKKKIFRCMRKETSQSILIYGRRRVGKSELIKHCLHSLDQPAIYYECKQTTEFNNVESICSLIAEQFNLPPLGFSHIGQVLEYLYRRSMDGDLILVLDEYPYLRAAVKGLDSIIQSLIDRYHSESKLKLILCGSYVETMRSLLTKNNPLYGRMDLIIDLKQMDYYESAMFYPSFSDEDKVRLYSVFGGVPYYNRLIDQSLSVKENIQELIAMPGARLENEVTAYLQTEISKITNANEVFEAMAKGFKRYSDIFDQSHVSSSPTLADVLDKLIKMEVIRKEAPINDEKNRKKTGYFIADNLSAFFYRYIHRYLSQMNVMDPDVFFERYIQKDFEEQYVPHCFEEVCKQYLIRMNRSGALPVIFDQIGKYYYDVPASRTNGEFDVVTSDPNGFIFYDAKFRKSPVTEKTVKEEIEQIERTGLKCYKYGFISRSGFDVQKDSTLILIDLHELYQ